jgi:LysM domain
LRNQLGTSTRFSDVLVIVLVVSFSPRAGGELAPSAGGYLVGQQSTYDIYPRDTLGGLARRYGLALSALTSANHLTPGSSELDWMRFQRSTEDLPGDNA